MPKIIKCNVIKGTLKDYEVEKHLLDSYSIREKIIKNIFFVTVKSKSSK